MKICDVIFDLDGTLIDSAPGILSSFRTALHGLGLTPEIPLHRDLVGPPLSSIIERLTPGASTAVRQEVATAFKSNYDSAGVNQATRFRGVDECLTSLKNIGLRLWLATNKRHTPTKALIAKFNWAGMFDGAFSLDTFSPPLKSKSELLEVILRHHEMDPDTTIYVGDRDEDGDAAQSLAIKFALATWGYGLGDKYKNCAVRSPTELLQFIRKI